MAPKRWIPLESNPGVLTRFGTALGLPPQLSFSDVWSLDLLDMVPVPRHAVLLLYPLTGPLASRTRNPTESQSRPFFCKQTIPNACGTIALLHAALNLPEAAPRPTESSFLGDFFQRTANLSPAERARALQDDERLDDVHSTFAAQGQTEAPPSEDEVDLHFVCFVRYEGRLWELDGRMENPVDWGDCEEVLEGAAKVIREEFMAKDPSEHRFTIMALTGV